jgi:hypothetical protein
MSVSACFASLQERRAGAEFVSNALLAQGSVALLLSMKGTFSAIMITNVVDLPFRAMWMCLSAEFIDGQEAVTEGIL